MNSLKTALLAGFAVLVASVSAAHAGYYSGSFTMSVFTGSTGGTGFSAMYGVDPFPAGVPIAAATFTYTGALGFDNTAPQNSNSSGDLNSTFFASAGSPAPSYGISNFTTLQTGAPFQPVPGIANYDNLADFLASSGSAANYQYGSFYGIDLGSFAVGTVLTFTHDDGATVFQGSTQVGTSKAGPTTVVTDQVTIGSTQDTTLYYSRQNGTPSILQVSVPEPASLVLLGAGLLGLGLVRSRRGRNAA